MKNNIIGKVNINISMHDFVSRSTNDSNCLYYLLDRRLSGAEANLKLEPRSPSGAEGPVEYQC